MAQTDTDENAKNKKKMWLIFGLVGLASIALSVGGTWYVTSVLLPGKQAEQEMLAAAQAESDKAPKPPARALYYPVKPPILVTFQVQGRQRYMSIDVALMTRDSSQISGIELHMPRIRNDLILLIGSIPFDEVKTAAGKELIRVKSLKRVQEILEEETGQPTIEQLLFTNMVLQ